jgi:hypothetical protein
MLGQRCLATSKSVSKKAPSTMGKGFLMDDPDADLRVPTRRLQGMARARSGQAAAWPLSSGRSVRRGSGVKRDFACAFTSTFTCARRPAATVTLEAGGADTYTQRAIPGSVPSQDYCTFRPL